MTNCGSVSERARWDARNCLQSQANGIKPKQRANWRLGRTIKNMNIDHERHTATECHQMEEWWQCNNVNRVTFASFFNFLHQTKLILHTSVSRDGLWRGCSLGTEWARPASVEITFLGCSPWLISHSFGWPKGPPCGWSGPLLWSNALSASYKLDNLGSFQLPHH